MEELFRNIFSKYKLTDEQLHKFISDYTTGLIITLIVNIQNLSKDDEVKLEGMIKSQDLEGVMTLLEGKFESKEAWTKYVESQAVPLLESYVKTVVA